MSGTSSEARGQGQDLNFPAHIEFFLAARAEGLFLGMLAWESVGGVWVLEEAKPDL